MGELIPRRRFRPLFWLGLALAAVAAMAVRLRRRCPDQRFPLLPEVPPGQTEEEAAARWSEGQDNTVHLEPPRTRLQIWRENLVRRVADLQAVGAELTPLGGCARCWATMPAAHRRRTW
jgi:hypothetical protein